MIAVILALLSLALDAAAFAVAVKGAIPLTGAVALHVILSGAIFLAAWWRREDRFLVLLAVTLPFTGPFGAACVLLALISHAAGRKDAHAVAAWRRSLNAIADEEDDEPARQAHERASDVTPFVDVMLFGETGDKLRAGGTIARSYRPDFMPALKLALADKDASVRVQAAAAVARIEAEFATGRQRIAQKRFAHEGQRLVAAATLDFDFAEAGLADPARRKEARVAVINTYASALRRRPDDPAALAGFGLACHAAGLHAKAAEAFAALELNYPPTDEVRAAYCDALFQLGRFGELHRVARGTRAAETRLGDALQLWGRHAA